jgi:hypothetical protein
VFELVCADGSGQFTKQFYGNVGSIQGNITIHNATYTWFNAPLPANHVIGPLTIPQGMQIMIEWRDWRGQQQEPYTISFTCEDILQNTIPWPPTSAQTNQNQGSYFTSQ